MPVESEGTGPYFTPDDSSLFVAVQHPGEETPNRPGANRTDPTTHTSWWPAGNKTAGQNPAMPRPSTVVITKVPPGVDEVPVLPPPDEQPPPPGGDGLPTVEIDAPGSAKAEKLMGWGGISVAVTLDEPGYGAAWSSPADCRVRSSVVRRRRRSSRERSSCSRQPGTKVAKLRARGLAKAALKRLPKRAKVDAKLTVTAVASSGERTQTAEKLKLK